MDIYLAYLNMQIVSITVAVVCLEIDSGMMIKCLKSQSSFNPCKCIQSKSGLGLNTHFGIKYRYNSAKLNSNTNTLFFQILVQIQIYTVFKFVFELQFSIQIQFKHIAICSSNNNMIQIHGPCFNFVQVYPIGWNFVSNVLFKVHSLNLPCNFKMMAYNKFNYKYIHLMLTF